MCLKSAFLKISLLSFFLEPLFANPLVPKTRLGLMDTNQSTAFSDLLKKSQTPASSKSVSESLESRFESIVKDQNLAGLAVGVIGAEGLENFYGFGYRDIDKKLPVGPETVFAIGSTTKAFTALLLSKQISESKNPNVGFDIPVKKILPDFYVANHTATMNTTLRDLLSHRSSLPRHDFAWIISDGSREQYYDRLQYLSFSRKFPK